MVDEHHKYQINVSSEDSVDLERADSSFCEEEAKDTMGMALKDSPENLKVKNGNNFNLQKSKTSMDQTMSTFVMQRKLETIAIRKSVSLLHTKNFK